MLVLHLRPLDAPVQLARFSLLVVVGVNNVVSVLVVVLSGTSVSPEAEARVSNFPTVSLELP